MKYVFKFGLLFGLCAVFTASSDSFAAKKQSAIQTGTKVRARVEATGVYDEDCHDKYYACMDNFCIVDNENGGTCACSDEAKKYESQLEEIKKILDEAERISTEEVEKVQAGANADIIFGNGERIYNKDGSVQKLKDRETKEKPKISLSSIYNNDDEDIWDDVDTDDFSGLTGRALYDSANKLCLEQMPKSCSKDMKLLTQMYSRQIVSDCKGLANSVSQKKQEADNTLKNAQAAVRGALKDSLEQANKYDRGTCMVEFKKCMMGADACGADWGNCVFTIAAENMQNNTAKSTARTKVKTTKKYDITASTMEMLDSKRFICERVLDSCVAVRDYVWDDFLRESAPRIRLAELNIESQKRQSCLSDISNCIQKACKDDIAGKGVATMDSCLSRPTMARSFCKIQIDPCERMEPQIWDYVVAKLAAMRVDACTAEVKECFTSEDRCGPDFANCIGMDFKFIHEICPIDKLVVCKQNNKDFSMSDLDSMLMGLYLNIDNKELENCQKIINEKMTEICGSTTDCNVFAADDNMGAGSLHYQKVNGTHRISGMIAFGMVDIGTTTEDAGLVDIRNYVKFLSDGKYVTAKELEYADAVVYELENIQGTINRVIKLIESDQKIQYCVNGRDLSQINGNRRGKNNTTQARFPNLLNQVKMQIATAALRKAQDNYNKKYNEYIAKAMQESNVDMANLMCNKLPAGEEAVGIDMEELNATALNKPGALVLEFGGVSNGSLVAGGTRRATSIGGARSSRASGAAAGGSDGGAVSTIASTIAGVSGEFVKFGGIVSSTLSFNPTTAIVDGAVKVAVALASDKYTSEFDGGTREMWSTFNRETRVCHLCTSTITQDCKDKGSRGFLGLWDSRGVECTSNAPVETCEDIQM